LTTILQSISGIWEHTGGPAESVPRLCSALTKKGLRVILATLNGPLSTAAVEAQREGVDVRTYPHYGQFSLSLLKEMKFLSGEADLIHGHGLWLPTNWIAGRYARKRNKPFVISLRGTVNPNALKHSYWKKRIAGHFFDDMNLAYASCLHATSLNEYKAIRSYGLNNPVAIIPNGINYDDFNSLPSKALLMNKYPSLGGKKIVLFMSRISWEKGLRELSESWNNISSDYPDWALLIVGSGSPDYVADIKSDFALHNGKQVVWTGFLSGDEKLAAYAAADLFVLPSHSENFSLVTAEALAAGLPVITTHGTPWSELPENKCGWWIPIGTEHLTRTMQEAMGLSDAERQRMGENGRMLIKSKYTWDQIADQMASVYDWILHRGSLPDCIKMN
jgi:glycosyltransferase involved in cell wall biosynthesis